MNTPIHQSLATHSTDDFERLICLPVSDCDHFAVLRGTRSCFKLSQTLHNWLTGGAIPDELILEQIKTEQKRLKALGFWYDAPQVTELSDGRLGISLHLVHGCNLACGYCNVQQGTYGESFDQMTWETARAAIDWLKANINGRDPKLFFYGGEPLLNWPVMQQAAGYMQNQFDHCEMEIVTNATLIDTERAAFLAEHDIFAIVSIDGPPEIHDQNRPAKSGQSSYDQARKGLEHLKEAGVKFHIRATWSPGHGNYDEIHAHLTAIAGGAHRVTVAYEFDTAGSESIEHYNKVIKKQFDAAAKHHEPLPMLAYQYLDQILRGDYVPRMSCEAGHAAFSVTPQGDLYPCQVAVSQKMFRIGNINESIEIDTHKVIDRFLHQRSPVCDACWAHFICSGPCRFALPIPEDWPYCRTVKLQVAETLKAIKRLTREDLNAVYMPSQSPQQQKSLSRGLALRDMLWQKHRHLKPLSIFPYQSKGDS